MTHQKKTPVENGPQIVSDADEVMFRREKTFFIEQIVVTFDARNDAALFKMFML